jgi:hypothetical protein
MGLTTNVNILPLFNLFIFDSFGARQAVYRNLWYIKSPLLNESCLLSCRFLISAKADEKTTQYK